MRKEGSHISILCENRVRLATHILERFQQSWPHVIWTRHFLERALKACSGQDSGTGAAVGERTNTNTDTAHSADNQDLMKGFTNCSTWIMMRRLRVCFRREERWTI
ncbi:hypothetical protein MAP00_004801 [Monascus purpureus]|nr:hypothetical protein MAP00_004801 [Monascus purpureus]